MNWKLTSKLNNKQNKVEHMCKIMCNGNSLAISLANIYFFQHTSQNYFAAYFHCEIAITEKQWKLHLFLINVLRTYISRHLYMHVVSCRCMHVWIMYVAKICSELLDEEGKWNKSLVCIKDWRYFGNWK